MFTFRHFTCSFLGIGSIGVINICCGKNKISLNACSFDRNSYKSENKIISSWDFNWDKRGPVSENELISDESAETGSVYLPKSARHIILIRHGHYNKDGVSDKEMVLTKLGTEQAAMTGRRLKELDIPYVGIVHSTLTRAVETAQIISSYIKGVPVKACMLLEEGAPIPPEPPYKKWKPPFKYHQDGARIEAAFRKYFYRADPSQEEDAYTIVVGHANVIRYFVCRALQYPAEGWLRLSLRHASLTGVTIEGSGHVVLMFFGDTGYMPPNALTE